MSFVHLHCHSNCSLLDGVIHVEQLVDRAAELGMGSLAITDHDALYGAVPFYHQARQKGVKPIIGAELTIEGDHHITLLATDWNGYGNLCRIITEAHLQDPDNDPYASMDILAQYAQGLICLSGCRRGQIPGSLLSGRPEQAERTARHYGEVFGKGNLYIELQWGPDSLQSRLLGQLVHLANKLRIPVVATGNIHFLKPDDHLIHRTLAAIRQMTTLTNVESEVLAPPECFFTSEAEMKERFRSVPEALDNTERIAERCDVTLPCGQPVFPRHDVPPDMTPLSALRQMALEGMRRRYEVETDELMKRLSHELSIIEQKGFTEYFLIVHDIVRFAQTQGIPVVGRGSAACSLVAYLLGITDADPVRYHLSFERFLNPSRNDPPDIDLDLCWRRRDEVLDYVYRKYGDDRVAMICTYATFRLRGAFREVAKAFGLPSPEINRVSRRLPSFGVKDIREALQRIPECRDLSIDQEPYRTIFQISQAISGFPRHLGIHCGGIVIGREALTRWLPLQQASKGIVITQYDMHSVEALGLVKIDLLGQRALTIVTDTVNMIADKSGTRMDVRQIREDDEKTANLIRRGQTLGCFQIESPGMRSLLRQMDARTPDDVIVALSLIRPGPAEAGMKDQFVRYRRGLEKVKYIHPILKEVLEDTYGIMLYQEDILKVASAVAGMSLAEADGLRRAVTKRRSPQEMAKNRQRFLDGALADGTSQQVAEAIWKRVAGFAAYSFCKAHAATYGQIAHQCCYLKAHHPAEYLAAVLANHAGYYPTSAYIEEARRMGIAILSPDINRSRREFTTEGMAIRVGLMQVRDLAEHSIQRILHERQHALFEDMRDFCLRVDISQTEIESLIRCGAMDGFGRTRPELLWELNLIYDGLSKERKRLGGSGLFSVSETFRMPAQVPSVPDYSLKQKVQFELDLLGFAVACHPLQLYQETLHREKLIPSHRLMEYTNQRVLVAGSLITSRRTRTAKGAFMKFLTLEDLHGTFEVVLFPDAYQRNGSALTSQGPYLVEGPVKNHYGSVAVVAETIRVIDADGNPKSKYYQIQNKSEIQTTKPMCRDL